jgi:hypothetical protein
VLKIRTVWFGSLPTDQRPAPLIGRPSAIMSPLRKCHFATRHRERRVMGIVDCSVPGITSRPPPRPRRLRCPDAAPYGSPPHSPRDPGDCECHDAPPYGSPPGSPRDPGDPERLRDQATRLLALAISDPSSKVTSNIRTKLTEPRTSTSALVKGSSLGDRR